VFNLLVGYAASGEGRGIVDVSRLFEHTDDEIAALFKDGTHVLFEKLIRFPCLFMHEGTNDELAHVGTITRAQISGRQIAIEYTYDLDIPPLLNSTIFDKKLEFGMPSAFEFSRTH
jgi:hypothetical protein